MFVATGQIDHAVENGRRRMHGPIGLVLPAHFSRGRVERVEKSVVGTGQHDGIDDNRRGLYLGPRLERPEPAAVLHPNGMEDTAAVADKDGVPRHRRRRLDDRILRRTSNELLVCRSSATRSPVPAPT
jgi:hypothetical protein